MIRAASTNRPPVSVVVPFHGTAPEAEEMLAGIAALELAPGDEVIVADNSPESVVRDPGPGIRAVGATEERSSYYARNVGAEHASGEWLLFIDADCRPMPALLDAYFSGPLPERCGIIAGGVVPAPEQATLIADYAGSRGHLDESFHIDSGPYPAGITANLLVRRALWASIGGFHEGVRSGADLELCWRAQELGWTLVHRPEARVSHVHVERLPPLLRKSARYGAGRLWVNRRYRGAFPRPRIARALVRSLGGALVWAVSGRFRRALFKLIDGLYVSADEWGYVGGDNRAGRTRRLAEAGTRPAIALLVDAFPARSETFILSELTALQRRGWPVRVQSRARPVVVERRTARSLSIDYVEDDPPRHKLRDLAWLGIRHPLGALRDIVARRRWAREEEAMPLGALAPVARRIVTAGIAHMHVHFAAGAALDALRLSRLTGIPYSITAHGFDIFQKPRNLPAKLEGAAFAAGTCGYTVGHLQGLVSDGAASRLHRLVMGVDPEQFRRRSPYPGGRTVVAIGRYVEKKGFDVLIEAVAELQRAEPLDRVLIAGDGPRRGELEGLRDRLGLGGVVEFPRVWGADGVRELLEGADVFAMPSVVASDGDRDSMPVVVKEALAMEIPVVASDAVGIPEMVRPEWGVLVPPGDPRALAAAIAGLLALPQVERARMGAAGREFVREHCDVDREAEKLSALIASAVGSENGNAETDRPAHDGHHLDEVVQGEVGSQ